MTAKILIVGPSWVGDMVMAQCLFKLLKQQDPTIQIDVLAPAWTFSILSCMPEVHKGIEFPIAHGELKLFERYRIAKQLQQQSYTEAIVLPNSFKSALIPWLARIPKRTGWRGECRYGLLNDIRVLNKAQYPLMIEQYMALGLSRNKSLAKPYPQPEFIVTQDQQEKIVKKFISAKTNKPALAICAGAEFGPAKRWPTKYYAEIANRKLAEGWDVWLFGSPKDLAITNEIMEFTQDRCKNLAGKLQLSETIALLSVVNGVVTNDSGLMHIAAALSKPLVALYGSTSPVFTPPLSSSATILKLDLECQPCFKRECPLMHYRCLQDLLPAQVLTAMSAWGK